ncbi:hypothetical protein CA264_17705 [Pontibacter actiniarum]|uniref:Outer membrane protein beta-barrel domain-containing protein n=2 Tax=Pontibacter actiniarum TaxID=323450 RepID=A0A1X9YW76_9BACT|nr:hypothetical protein CA264_17705 [Pontibacter actiniarum]
MGYNLQYKGEPRGGDIYTYGVLNVGYWLNKRARVQVGITYGGAKFNNETTLVEAEDRLVHYEEISNTKGVAAPLVLDYVLLYPFRRLQLYGTAMFTPIFSVTNHKTLERREDITTVTSKSKASGINAYITAGFGLCIPISTKLDLYGNYYFLSRSFNRRLRRKDEYPYPGSLALGLDYNFTLKRKK